MNSTDINIYLNGEEVEQGTVASPERVDEPSASQPTQTKQSTAQKASKTTAVIVGLQIGKQAVNFASSRVGSWTGNTQIQRTVDLTGKLATYGTAFAINPLLGGVALALDFGSTAADFYFNRSQENLSLNVLRQRAGVTQNRSR